MWAPGYGGRERCRARGCCTRARLARCWTRRRTAVRNLTPLRLPTLHDAPPAAAEPTGRPGRGYSTGPCGSVTVRALGGGGKLRSVRPVPGSRFLRAALCAGRGLNLQTRWGRLVVPLPVGGLGRRGFHRPSGFRPPGGRLPVAWAAVSCAHAGTGCDRRPAPLPVARVRGLGRGGGGRAECRGVAGAAGRRAGRRATGAGRYVLRAGAAGRRMVVAGAGGARSRTTGRALPVGDAGDLGGAAGAGAAAVQPGCVQLPGAGHDGRRAHGRVRTVPTGSAGRWPPRCRRSGSTRRRRTARSSWRWPGRRYRSGSSACGWWRCPASP